MAVEISERERKAVWKGFVVAGGDLFVFVCFKLSSSLQDLFCLLPHKSYSVGKRKCMRHCNVTAQSLSFPVTKECDL